MSKKYAVFITVLFCAFLGAFAVANALTPDREFSPMENRYLAQRPTLDRRDFTLSWSAAGTGDFFSGKFMSDFERYVTDQFVGRDGWIAAKAAAEKLSGKGENNGVYLCKKETLIPRFDRPDARRVTDNLNYVNKLVEHVDIPVYFALIPGKVSVWADRLPEGAPNADESAILREAAAASRARWVDVQGALLAHAGEELAAMGLVLEGRVDILSTDYWGSETLMARLGPGELFGEVFAGQGVELPYDLVAAEDCRILWLRPDRLMTGCCEACGFHQRLQRNLLALLAARTREMSRKAAILSQRSIRGRLMEYLSDRARAAGSASFELGFTRQRLADYLAVDRSAMTVELGKMQKEGILRVERRQITLLTLPDSHRA